MLVPALLPIGQSTGNFSEDDVALFDNYAYVSSWESGLTIYSIDNPMSPVMVSRTNNGEAHASFSGVVVAGNQVYLPR